jgi:hypothetical protein
MKGISVTYVPGMSVEGVKENRPAFLTSALYIDENSASRFDRFIPALLHRIWLGLRVGLDVVPKKTYLS